ncbi:MAG: oligosaccharide flippase family protein [bacterium]|nr:oligosaccharide flippase family protein [bacterium]
MIANNSRIRNILINVISSEHYQYFWKSSFTVLAAILLGKATSLIWKVVLARLGPESLGFTQFILNILTLTSGFALLGLPATLTRFVAIAHSKHNATQVTALFYFVLRVTAVTSLFAVSIFVMILLLFSDELSMQLLKDPQNTIILVGIPFLVFTEVISSYLNGVRRVTSYSVLKYLLPPLLRLSLLGLLLLFGFQNNSLLTQHILLSTIIASLGGLMLSHFSWNKVKTKLKPVLQRELIKYSVPVSGSFLLFIAFGSLDTLLINKYIGITAVGLYSVLLLLSEITDIFFLSFINLIQPYLGSLFDQKRKGGRFVILTCLFLVVGGVAISLPIYIFRDFILDTLFGSEYAVVGSFVAFILLQKVLESALVMPLRHFLDFYGYVKETFSLMLLMLIIKVGLSWYLISHYGFYGAMISQVIIQVIHAAACVGLITVIFKRQLYTSIMKSSVVSRLLHKLT